MDPSTPTSRVELAGERHAGASKTCRQCGRSFSRNKHLHRHELIHTQEMPFRCSHCNQRYQRADVLRRHVKRFCQGRAGVIQDSVAASEEAQNQGSFPCGTCEQQGRLCTAARVINADRNASTRLPPVSGAFSNILDISSATSFPGLRSSVVGRRENSNLLDGAVHFQDLNGLGDEAPEYHDTRSKNLRQHIFGSPTPGGSIQAAATGTFGEDDDISLNGPPGATLYSQPHSSISASFEPLFQAIDVMIQQEVATQLGPRIEQPTMKTSTTSSQVPINYDFMSLWDEGSYDDIWQSPSHFFDNLPLEYDPLIPISGDVMDFEISGTSAPIWEISSLTASPSAALKAMRDNQRFNSRASSPRRHQEQPRWLLDPPSRRHDPEIVNVFLNLFTIYIATTFTTFQDFHVAENTPASLILAIAAVGGLFCKIEGSFRVAIAMHNDARRIMLTRVKLATLFLLITLITDIHYKVFTVSTYEHREMIGVVQLYVLFYLFGICSGDKRYYECSEVFHKQLIETVYQFRLLDVGFSTSEEAEQARRRLINGLHLLESYRVILLQQPPNLYPSTTQDSISLNNIDLALRANPENAESEEDILPSIRLLVTPDSPAKPFLSNAHSTWCLAALSIYSWQSVSSGPIDRGSDILWKQEFFELALNRWATAYSHMVEPGVMLLFHMNLIGLLTNLKRVHHVAQLHLRGKRGLTDPSYIAIRRWHDSHECERAVWHANELLNTAEDLSNRRRSAEEEEDIKTSCAGESLIEAPYIPFCIYLSTLTLWATAIVEGEPAISSAKAHLDRGVHILGYLKVQIAQVLRRVLRRLIKAMDDVS